MRTLVLAGLFVFGAVSVAHAQVVVHGSFGARVVPHSGHHFSGHRVSGHQVTVHRPHYVQGSTMVGGFYPQPSGPAIVTSNQVSSIDPFTGAVNTSNTQIDHSAFAAGRLESMNNGTKRWVNRPIYNSMGQVVGYQEGYVWNNSLTGQEHGNLTNFTPNNSGGVHVQQQTRSRPSVSVSGSISNARPSTQGIHTQAHFYNRRLP